MPDRDGYVDALTQRLDELREEIESDRQQSRELLEEIHAKEQLVEHILNLLVAEGIALGNISSDDGAPKSVSDVAFEVLSRLPEPKPVYYRDLVDLIMAEGKHIPGKNPGANLISHLTRDERFIRTGRGTYGLAEWGLEPAQQAKPLRRKRRRRQG